MILLIQTSAKYKQVFLYFFLNTNVTYYVGFFVILCTS